MSGENQLKPDSPELIGRSELDMSDFHQIPWKQMIVAVKGNIGSGKTETAKAIVATDIDRYACVLEPVKEWQDKKILDAFYKNMDKFALAFQLYTFSSRLRHLKAMMIKHPSKDIIMDGGIFLDKYMFKEALRDGGHIDEMSNVLYEATFEDWKMLMPDNADPKLLIWVDTPPEVCLQRLKDRNREEECNVSLEYLELLEVRLKDMMKKLDALGYPILRIDGRQSLEDITCAASLYIKELDRNVPPQ